MGLEKGLVLNIVYLQCLKNGKTLWTKRKCCTISKAVQSGALLTDLSKAFDCLPHKRTVAKLNAYGFKLPALKLIHSYLSHRKQRTKVNHAYSSWDEILFGVPQGSILRPILFNIFLSDLFLVISNTDFSSYVDDNTIYDSGNSIDDVISSLQESAKKLLQWFSHNQMKANTDKCQLIVSTDEPVEIRVGESLIKSSTCEKLLGIRIDNKLNFDTHVKGLCTKANNKLRTLARATPYMSLEKKRSFS